LIDTGFRLAFHRFGY